eukprot:gene7498-5283_t
MIPGLIPSCISFFQFFQFFSPFFPFLFLPPDPSPKIRLAGACEGERRILRLSLCYLKDGSDVCCACGNGFFVSSAIKENKTIYYFGMLYDRFLFYPFLIVPPTARNTLSPVSSAFDIYINFGRIAHLFPLHLLDASHNIRRCSSLSCTRHTLLLLFFIIIIGDRYPALWCEFRINMGAARRAAEASDTPPPVRSSKLSPLEERVLPMVAGGLSGVAGVCVTNPLDTLRVRLSAGTGATGKSHKSLLRTAKELLQNGIFHTLTRGLGANVIATVPSLAVYFPTYRYLRTHLSADPSRFHIDTRFIPFLSASGAVVTTNAVVSPLFVIRTQVQVVDHIGFREVARNIWRAEGCKGFYRGTLTNTLGRVVEEGTFWTLYEYLRRKTECPTLRDGGSFAAASLSVVSLTMVSKLTAATLTYPYNVVMNHLRTVNKSSGTYHHFHVLPTAIHGLAPHLLRGVAAMSTQMYAFELAMYYLVESEIDKIEDKIKLSLLSPPLTSVPSSLKCPVDDEKGWEMDNAIVVWFPTPQVEVHKPPSSLHPQQRCFLLLLSSSCGARGRGNPHPSVCCPQLHSLAIFFF